MKIEINEAVLRKLNAVTTKSETRYLLRGVLVRPLAAENAVEFAATDGAALVTFRRPLAENETLPKEDIIVNLQAVKAKKDTIIILSDDNAPAGFCFAQSNKGLFTCQILDGTYPNYRMVLPASSEEFDALPPLDRFLRLKWECVKLLQTEFTNRSEPKQRVINGPVWYESEQDGGLYKIAVIPYVKRK